LFASQIAPHASHVTVVREAIYRSFLSAAIVLSMWTLNSLRICFSLVACFSVALPADTSSARRNDAVQLQVVSAWTPLKSSAIAPAATLQVLALRHRLEVMHGFARAVVARVIEYQAFRHWTVLLLPRDDVRARFAVECVAIAIEAARGDDAAEDCVARAHGTPSGRYAFAMACANSSDHVANVADT
jgi:hypothetical protein